MDRNDLRPGAPEARGSPTGHDASGCSPRPPSVQLASDLETLSKKQLQKVLCITSPVMSGSAGQARGCTGPPAKPPEDPSRERHDRRAFWTLGGFQATRHAMPCGHEVPQIPDSCQPFPLRLSSRPDPRGSPSLHTSTDIMARWRKVLWREGKPFALIRCGAGRRCRNQRYSYVLPPYSVQAVW